MEKGVPDLGREHGVCVWGGGIEVEFGIVFGARWKVRRGGECLLMGEGTE